MSWKILEKYKSIGVFDSGIGGLTVVSAIINKLPKEKVTYFGDTARVPYGGKSKDIIREYALEDAHFLVKQGVKMIVIACNTVSSIAIDEIKNELDIPVIGMIHPGALTSYKKSKNKRIGVIGTTTTIKSRSYTRALHELDTSVLVFSKACPLFVPIAEEGWSNHRVASIIAMEYILPFKRDKIDTLILGCTHYPILRNVIQKAAGQNVTLVDSGISAADEVSFVLNNLGIANDSTKVPDHTFFVSDIPQQFKKLGEIFLGINDLYVTKVHF